MVIFKTARELREYLGMQDGKKSTIGFIPTMGALHAGHISLIERAKKQNFLTVCSIFLNPTQFNDVTDFEQYPVSTDNDIELLLKSECDVLFLPSINEIYPEGPQHTKTYDFGYLDTILEGANRPGHFKGVGQVVGRLFEIVNPDTLFLGQKDFQQCMVITRLKEMLGVDQLKIDICPTLREADGLAMSSRNRRLTEPQRTIAAVIYQCLVSIQAKQDSASFAIVKKECFELLNNKGFTTEYVALADARTLELMDEYDRTRPMVTLIAAKIGDIRLIDNLMIN